MVAVFPRRSGLARPIVSCQHTLLLSSRFCLFLLKWSNAATLGPKFLSPRFLHPAALCIPLRPPLKKAEKRQDDFPCDPRSRLAVASSLPLTCVADVSFPLVWSIPSPLSSAKAAFFHPQASFTSFFARPGLLQHTFGGWHGSSGHLQKCSLCFCYVCDRCVASCVPRHACCRRASRRRASPHFAMG